MVTAIAQPRGFAVAKKTEDKQVTFRLASDLHARLSETADGMSLDISSLLRLMIREHLPGYEVRARDIAEREQQSSRDGN